MALVFLSLMVILSSAEGYWQPSIPIHNPQVERVHSVHSVQGTPIFPVAAVPVGQTVSHPNNAYSYSYSYRPIQIPSFTSRLQTVNNRGFRITDSFDPFRPGFTRGSVPTNRFTSGNIVQVAKAQAKETLNILQTFEGSELAAQFIDPVFETSDCLNSLEDVTTLIEEGTMLIVDNGPEIIYLEAIVDNLKGEKDIIKLIRGSSKMLRTLANLGPALAAGTSNLCISSPTASVTGFKDLARTLRNIGNNKKLNMPARSRQLLETSSDIMEATAGFLDAQLKAIDEFNTQCKTDNKNQVAIYDLMVDIMGSLARMFQTIGFEDKVTEVNKQSQLIKKFADSFTGLEDLDIDLDCGLVGDYNTLAQIQDDLLEIIEQVGVEKLSEELGIDLKF